MPRRVEKRYSEQDAGLPGNAMQYRFERKALNDPSVEEVTEVGNDRAIGEVLRRLKGYTQGQVEQILTFQREHAVRFGDAAVALGLAEPREVLWALSQQFHYHYSPGLDAPMHEELVMANHPFSEKVEAFRDLRSQLLLSGMGGNRPQSALAIVSSNVGDGKTFIAANLAAAFSQLPGRTLIIDADMRSPRLHELFRIDGVAGLSSVLSSRTEPNVIRPVADLPNLYVMPVGTVPPNPSELLQHPGFGALIAELTAKFNHVLVDTPAAAHGSDARVIAAQCGHALVVGRRDKTNMLAAQTLVGQLGKSAVRIAGVVFNEF